MLRKGCRGISFHRCGWAPQYGHSTGRGHAIRLRRAAPAFCLSLLSLSTSVQAQDPHDNCSTTLVHPVPINTTITLFEDNSGASGSDCLPNPGELGWWEAFEITEAANVTIDFCDTDPVHRPSWSFLRDNCSCIGFYPVSFFDRTATCPFNISLTWLGLPPGIYYYPVYTVPGDKRCGNNGAFCSFDFQCAPGYPCTDNLHPYEMHITAKQALGSCCNAGFCDDGVFESDCNGVGGEFSLDDCTCRGCGAIAGGPSNDFCSAAMDVTGAAFPVAFDTTLATLDGPSPIETELLPPDSPAPACPDIWYLYTSPCTGDLTVSLCEVPWNFDSMVSIFSGGCPGDGGIDLGSDDESCSAPLILGGPGTLTIPTTAASTYTIRVSGYGGSRGAGILDIVCVPANEPPDCDAGGPYTTECAGSTTSIQLDGTGSSDPDVGDTLSYAWTTDCPGGTFDDASSATPTLTVDSSSLCPTPCNVMLTVTDDYDASDPCSTTVTVEDTGSPSVTLTGNPLLVPLNSLVNFSAAYDDDCGAPHSATWDFGDGSPPVVDNPAGDPAASSHSYSASGIYVVTATITDDCGNSGSDSVVVVVYSPADGFTTGGGWIIPDSESFINNIGVTDTVSKANFGFVVKYHQGASNPNGNLEFQYKAGNINLKSNSGAMEWLVITSATKVRFKGQGTINGTGLYTFKVTAEDNGEPGTGTDTFKIEIWTGVVDTENGPPTPKHLAKGVLGGGNIQIHN